MEKTIVRRVEDVINALCEQRMAINKILNENLHYEELNDISGLLTCGIISIHSAKSRIVENEIRKTDHEKGKSYLFNSRGIGIDHCPCCFVCGALKRASHMPDLLEHQLNNISAFVSSKEEGKLVCAMFELDWENTARLDFRSHEPEWIQVKVGSCNKHLPNLQKLHDTIIANYGRIRQCDIVNAVGFPGGKI